MPLRRSLPPLAALRAFEAAGRRLSFRSAANELSVTATAISHQIWLLEQTLGLRLFHREMRRVRLTAEGAVLLLVLRDGFDVFAEAIDQIRGRHSAGLLTLSASLYATRPRPTTCGTGRAQRPGVSEAGRRTNPKGVQSWSAGHRPRALGATACHLMLGAQHALRNFSRTAI
ncbi:LysR family transcriptional regulator [Methylorubrum extorquens]|uniref:LysR family transcriptional regulator n=1 Tax=Methylorubrum extorquens TaxID=408 RepID=UPI0035A243D3